MGRRMIYLILAVFMGLPAFADNGVPHLMPFQGRVTDVNGVPIKRQILKEMLKSKFGR